MFLSAPASVTVSVLARYLRFSVAARSLSVPFSVKCCEINPFSTCFVTKRLRAVLLGLGLRVCVGGGRGQRGLRALPGPSQLGGDNSQVL